MTLNITEKEKEILINILQREEQETRVEIHHSDNHDFKESLKARLIQIQKIITKLKSD